MSFSRCSLLGRDYQIVTRALPKLGHKNPTLLAKLNKKICQVVAGTTFKRSRNPLLSFFHIFPPLAMTAGRLRKLAANFVAFFLPGF